MAFSLRHWIPRFVAAFAATSIALAQDTTVWFEDFTNGLPPGSIMGGTFPHMWRIVGAGECGALSNMAACNAVGFCNYAAPSAIGGQFLGLPEFTLPATDTTAALLTFDYILDVDSLGNDDNGATGEYVTVAVHNWLVSGYPFLAQMHLVNDGALHTVTMDIQFAVGGPFDPNWISFYFQSDGFGDQGRGFMLDNVRVSLPSPSDAFCVPSAASPCPCPSGTTGAMRGCPTSLGFGAILRGAGNPSVSADTYRLAASAIPPGAPVVFFESATQQNVPFGDGRRCVAAPIRRLGIRTFANGTPVLPDIGEVAISAISPQIAGSTRYYQALFRDPIGPCGSGINLTNAWQVTWGP